jgi:hypothetical protein
MNKKPIALIMIILTILPISATYYLDDNGYWYSYDKKTGKREELSSEKNVSDPQYWERNYPYQSQSDYTSFGSDRTYEDQTNRDMGNR